MNRSSYRLLVCLWLLGTLAPAQIIHDESGRNVPLINQGLVAAGQAHSLGSEPSKSTEMLKILFEGKSPEAAQFAIDHLTSLVPAYLEADPKKQKPFLNEVSFIQFIQAYQLGTTILSHLPESTDALRRASLTEMVGQEEQALTLYKNALDDLRMRKRYAFLLAKHGRIQEAKDVLAGVDPRNLGNVVQSLQSMIYSQNLFIKRLDSMDLLITALEHADSATYLPAEWLPSLINNNFAQGHYSNDENDVRLVELYANGDYRTGYNSPEQEERSRAASERRVQMHEALCKAMMRLPQFADEGFRRYSGMASKHGVESDLSELAIAMLKMPPAPKPPESESKLVIQHENFNSNWVPFHTPIEFLLRAAIQNDSLDQLITSLTPILTASGKTDQLTLLKEFKTTLESSIDGFPEKVAALMQMNQDSISTNNLVRLLMEVMKSRQVEDMGLLIEAYFVRIGDTPYPALQEVVDYAKAQRKLGMEQFQAFMKKVSAILLGPADQQATFIAEHYQPNTHQANTPNMRVTNYLSFLNQLGQQLELLAPVLAEVYALSLNHPNDSSVRRMVSNALQSWNYRNQSSGLPQFIKDSPFLNDLANFQPYPLQNVQKESVFGHFLDSLRELSGTDRSRYLQTVRNHKPDTFGKQVILAYLDAGSSSSKRSIALAQVLEKQTEAIGKLPKERQLALYEWFRQMHSSRSSLSSSIRTASPKTATWYESMKQEASKQPSLVNSRQRRSNANSGLPSVEAFLTTDKRQAIETQQPLQFMATQLAQSVLSTDLNKAEAIFAKYLKLATQPPSTNFDPGNGIPPAPIIDLFLSRLLQGSPGTENLGFVIKMIHLANDPNQGVYPSLQSSMAQALANESFEPVTTLDNAMASTFLTASGGQVHEMLVPLLLTRFQTVEPETLENILVWAKDHPNNALSGILHDTSDLALAFASKDTRPVATPGLIRRLTNATTPLGVRVEACPSIFHMALQAQAWPIAEACLTVLGEAFADERFVVSPMFTEKMIAAPVQREVTDDEKRILERLLVWWSAHSDRLPMSIAALQRATTLAARAEYPTNALVVKLPKSLQRQPGFVTSMLRMGDNESALRAVPWSLVTMPPPAQMQNNRRNTNRGSGLFRSGEQLSAPINRGQGQYDADLHAKSVAFLPKISDAGQRLFVEFTIAALTDTADLPDTIPNRAARLLSLAERYDRKLFSSPYLAEHTVSWLCTASGSIPKPLRDDVDHFGRQIAYQPLSKWTDQAQRASRMNLWTHFLKDASTNAPEVFATVINEMLAEIGSDRNQSQQLLEAYVGDFPKDLLKDVASITSEQAASYLPLLKTLAKLARSSYWSGRDSCINGNIVMHILANQSQAYGEWKDGLDMNTRRYLEDRMNLDEIIYMMRKTLSTDEVTKERRSEILNGLFATTAPNPNNTSNNNSSRSPDANVFERMIDLDVLTTQDILDNGPQWAEENPRGGAAFGELAKYQADAGQLDEAIVNYTQAVVHAPAENQRLYTQYHLANANLLLQQDRVTAAMTWFDFAQSGRIHVNYKLEHDALKRQVQVRFLTNPERMTATFTQASQQLATNPNDVAAWLDLTKTLSAYGGDRMSQSDYMRGLSVLKLSYYLLQKVKPLDPSAVDALLPAVTADLTKSLVALGIGGRKNYLIPRGQRWSYHYPEEGLYNGSWKMAPMQFQGWDQAKAPIGYGNGNEATLIGFGDDEANKPITAYFNKLVTIEGMKEGDQLTLAVLHDDGVIVYIDGKEVARNNMPNGAVSPQSQAPSSRGGSDEKEYWTVTIPSTAFSSGKTSHIIAAEVHQNDPDSSDLSFDLELYTEAFNKAAIIEEIETGTPLKQLAKWKDHLPENLVEMAKGLTQ